MQKAQETNVARLEKHQDKNGFHKQLVKANSEFDYLN